MRRIKKVNRLIDGRIEDVPADFSKVPIKINRVQRSRAHLTSAAIAGGLAIIYPGQILSDALKDISFVSPSTIMWTVGGLAVTVFSLVFFTLEFLFPIRQSIRIDRGVVRVVNSGGKFGEDKWTAPLDSFVEVLWLCTDGSFGINERGFERNRGHLIKLIHPDIGKSVVLYGGHSSRDAEAVCSMAAKIFKLPKRQEAKDWGEDEYSVYMPVTGDEFD